jgi:hypothetical protein
MGHWTFIALAYGFTAACIAAELVALASHRRKAAARALLEKDFDEDDR